MIGLTQGYSAPEINWGWGKKSDVTDKSDIFSLGV